MKRDSVVAIVDGLNQNQVRYLIVGGLAVVAHGYVRFTADVDLLLSVEADNLKRAVAALKALRYRPRAPVGLDDFVDPANRKQWAQEKNMTVFSLFSDIHPATEIDLFLEPPIDFDGAYARAIRKEVAPGTTATFCSRFDLIELKTLSDRPVDREDIEKLKLLPEDSDD
jgi:hypothetical protein